jgi:hypothetical protein
VLQKLVVAAAYQHKQTGILFQKHFHASKVRSKTKGRCTICRTSSGDFENIYQIAGDLSFLKYWASMSEATHLGGPKIRSRRTRPNNHSESLRTDTQRKGNLWGVLLREAPLLGNQSVDAHN